ncbi:MAG: Cys-tRNA(Pro) deacylase [Erysipelotrichaceae bacterium]
MNKTNAMRILDKAHMTYTTHTYPHPNGVVDGMSVASLTNQNPSQVFKTLITSASHQYYVFMLPVNSELNLKAGAKAVQEKSLSMIPVKDIQKISGYIRGGCSPIGMKKQFKTIIDQSAFNFETILFSGGQIGTQIEMNPKDLINLIQGQAASIIE